MRNENTDINNLKIKVKKSNLRHAQKNMQQKLNVEQGNVMIGIGPVPGQDQSNCGSNQIEDEIHLLFHCLRYSIFRDKFYRKIEYHLPNIKRLSTLQATKELMNSDNYFVNIQLMRIILSCLNLRNNLLSVRTDNLILISLLHCYSFC